MPQPYSDLQVVMDASSAPEIVQPEKIPLQRSEFRYHEPVEAQPVEAPVEQVRTLGLSRRWFWILLVSCNLVILGAVVGGVVAGTSHQSSATSQQSFVTTSQPASTSTIGIPAASTSAPAPASASATATSTSTSVPLTTTEIIGPSQTLYRDCPSSNDTIYDALGSPEYQFRKLCNVGFLSNTDDVVNKPTANLNDCVDQCIAYNTENNTEIASGQNQLCTSVCWINTLDSDFPGQCFGSTSTNSSTGGFTIQPQHTECDSAIWINQEGI